MTTPNNFFKNLKEKQELLLKEQKEKLEKVEQQLKEIENRKDIIDDLFGNKSVEKKSPIDSKSTNPEISLLFPDIKENENTVSKETQNFGSIQVQNIVSDKENIGKFPNPFLEILLYKGSKNKVFFRVGKIYPLLDENKEEKLDSMTLEVFKTDKPLSEFNSMYDEGKLYKKLDIQNKEYSFSDFVEVNKDFYLYVKAIYKLKNKGSITRFSNIYKINIIKDEEYYYLKNEIYTLEEKKTPQFNFTEKIFIEPVFDDSIVEGNIPNVIKKLKKPFVSTDDTFDSASDFPYIKIRLISKKTNRKIDINLKYEFVNNTIKAIDIVSGEEMKKFLIASKK